MEKIKIKIPDGWNEIPIGTYQEMIGIEADSDISRLRDVIEILTDIDISNAPLEEVTKITQCLAWMQKLPDEKKLNKKITIDGIDYHLIERFESFTLGEWIDLELFGKDRTNNLHKIFAILYRPLFNGKIEEYDSTTLEERAKIFRDHMMIGDAYATMIFFFNIGMVFSKHFQNSL